MISDLLSNHHINQMIILYKSRLASALGPERTREELIPFLTGKYIYISICIYI